jgi:hypothetical protein
MNELVAIAVIVAAVSGQPVARVDREVVRLRDHFAQVDRELRARDVAHLTPQQQHARATHMARLRAYAARGVFPLNTRHAGAYVPYFVDDAGTRCAMAYLIEQSGAGDFVARVASRLNFAYIADIARDPEFGPALQAWLEANGLTLDEAARIQPAYDGGPCCTVDDPPPVPTSYKVGSGATILTGLTSVALNASMVQLGLSRRAGGWIGVGVGAVGMALGASALDEGEEYGTLRALNGGVGVLAAGLGLYALLSRPASAPTATAQRESRLTGSPWVAPDGTTGVVLNLRF